MNNYRFYLNKEAVLKPGFPAKTQRISGILKLIFNALCHLVYLVGNKNVLLVQPLLLFLSCNILPNENENGMSTKDIPVKFSLLGTWKIKSAAKDNNYALPEIIVFSGSNSYSISGKEEQFHPILDGGWYEYDSVSHVLKINTANDAIKKFNVKEKKDGFSLIENEKIVGDYTRH